MNLQHTCKLHIAIALTLLFLMPVSSRTSAQGTWSALTNFSPHYNLGVMLLLPDGSVIVKTSASSTGVDVYGDTWDKLTPDSTGSYINGTWSAVPPMACSRLYFSSQVLTDGRVYVAGGEYGTGSNTAEVYNPVTNTWTPVPSFSVIDPFYDANSAMLPDGRVLQATPDIFGGDCTGTYIYDPVTNSFSLGPNAHGSHAETIWLRLADNTIIFADDMSVQTERYFPSSAGAGAWVADANTTASLYDFELGETGSAQVLPDGRAVFFGGSGNTQFYTPSGGAGPGSWAAGASMPLGKGSPDAPSIIMPDGKILCAVSDTAPDPFTFPSPTYFYEFDYLTNTWTNISAPSGADTLDGPCYTTCMLQLPDGNVLFSHFYDSQYYVYTPTGTALAAGKPTIDTVIKLTCIRYMAIGHKFNGVGYGATYGDDWQMATNYPIVRLTAGSKVYYARSHNWNSTGIQRGALTDTTYFDLPAGLPTGSYNVQVVANGNPSAGYSITTCDGVEVATVTPDRDHMKVTPNPATTSADVSFCIASSRPYTIKLIDITGQLVKEEAGTAHTGVNTCSLNLTGLSRGMYSVILNAGESMQTSKLVIEH